MKARSLYVAAMMSALFVAQILIFAAEAQAQRRPQQRGAICGDPTSHCPTTATFEPYDLPFRIPRNAVIWESEDFYALILRSMRYTDQTCERNFIPESARLAAQEEFPHNKVFATRCTEAGSLYYTNVAPNTNFMAVYAGHTQMEAARLLNDLRSKGKFQGASIRRMRAGFNGT
ncbi:MAG TPA: hypothetical protein VK619_10110 [Pyrinomonadaceae bacterium]|nr:hypothetical protein [Pyrinomonadaceae bacterium]